MIVSKCSIEIHILTLRIKYWNVKSMSATHKYQLWIHQCQEVIWQAQMKKIRQKRLLAALVRNEISLQLKKKKIMPKNFFGFTQYSN